MTNTQFIIRALDQVAVARRERDYPRAMKWLSYARAFRLTATAPVAPLTTVEDCKRAFDRRTRNAQKILRHGMHYSMNTGAFFNMLINQDKK